MKEDYFIFSAFLWFLKAICKRFSEMIANNLGVTNLILTTCFNPSFVYTLPSSAVWQLYWPIQNFKATLVQNLGH